MPDESLQRADRRDVDASMVGKGRSRRRLPGGSVCYLCGEAIAADQSWDRDHLPPARVFGSSDRVRYSPQLLWLYRHKSCNRAFKDDEGDFVVAFAGHVDTPTARAVWDDVRNAAIDGHERVTCSAFFGPAET